MNNGQLGKRQQAREEAGRAYQDWIEYMMETLSNEDSERFSADPLSFLFEAFEAGRKSCEKEIKFLRKENQRLKDYRLKEKTCESH